MYCRFSADICSQTLLLQAVAGLNITTLDFSLFDLDHFFFGSRIPGESQDALVRLKLKAQTLPFPRKRIESQLPQDEALIKCFEAAPSLESMSLFDIAGRCWVMDRQDDADRVTTNDYITLVDKMRTVGMCIGREHVRISQRNPTEYFKESFPCLKAA